MKKIFLLILLVFSFSQAQECKSLLESMYPDASQLNFKTVEAHTTSEMTFNDFTVKSESFIVIDRENRRMYSKTITEQMTVLMIIQNDDFSMRVEMPDGSTMPMPALPAMRKQLESYFDNIFGQTGLPQNFDVVSCDGPTTIPGIISGEQITILAKLPKFDIKTEDEDSELQWQEQEMTMIVDKTNEVTATLMTMPEMGNILMLMKLEKAENGFTKSINMTSYIQKDGEYQQSGTINMEYSNLNQPVDESLFQTVSE